MGVYAYEFRESTLRCPENKAIRIYENYMELNRESGKLMLFAGDQKVEHLNDDFYGEGIPEDDSDPEHFFEIASKAKIGVLQPSSGFNHALWDGL